MLIDTLTAQQQKDISDCYDRAVANVGRDTTIDNKSDKGQIFYSFIDYIDDLSWIKELNDQNRHIEDYRFDLHQELFEKADPVKNFAQGQAVNQ